MKCFEKFLLRGNVLALRAVVTFENIEDIEAPG